ncbi:hypothetical protein GMO_12190 [Gluconobacter morbifer G707]|uniref:Uncharacterized protein n=1 Tax=Gluconobacter morbifer G707 TaxID=1088869 RepID=G6XI09_9PROT|nr:hypothetical protein GMO_12190 [Gluconobacter morbifer G707]
MLMSEGLSVDALSAKMLVCKKVQKGCIGRMETAWSRPRNNDLSTSAEDVST